MDEEGKKRLEKMLLRKMKETSRLLKAWREGETSEVEVAEVLRSLVETAEDVRNFLI